MIRVVMTDNKSPETYKAGTKFAVDRGTGNLSVYNDSKEEIAVHAHGTWASVSVDNTQNYADKLTPEMVSGEWPTVFSDSNVYDCRGTSYIRGVTTFSVENVCEALRACGLSQRRENLTLLIDPSLFNRLDDRSELDNTKEGTKWHRFNIEVNPVDQDLTKGFLDTLIWHTSGKTIKLITREF